MRVILLVALLSAVISLANGQKTPLKILFAGNSLTSVNNLPKVVQTLSKSSSSLVDITTVGSSLLGGSSLREHALLPEDYASHPEVPLHTIGRIREGGWDYVVLQQQSIGYFLLGPQHFDTYGTPIFDSKGRFTGEYDPYVVRLDREARNVGASTILYANWQAEQDFANQTELVPIIEGDFSYAAGRLRSYMAPAVTAFNMAFSEFGSQLYADSIHPTKMGTYLVACVFYAVLTDVSPEGLNNGGFSLNSAVVTRLQQLAWAAYTDFRDRKTPLCSPSSCIRFQGTVVPPSTSTTSTAPPTSTDRPPDPPLPTAAGCEALRLQPDSNLLADSSVLSAEQGRVLTSRLLEDACASGWVPCYNATADGFSAEAFHRGCDFRGPTLSVFRVGHGKTATPTNGRIFGGFAPVSWESRESSVVTTGVWIYRFDPDDMQALETIVPESKDSKALYDYSNRCPIYGRSADVTVDGTCKRATFLKRDYANLPPDFSATWFAGAVDVQLDAVEIFYSPALAPPASTTASTVATTTTKVTTTTTTTTKATTTATSTKASTTSISKASTVKTTPAPTTAAPVTTTTTTLTKAASTATSTKASTTSISKASTVKTTPAPTTAAPTSAGTTDPSSMSTAGKTTTAATPTPSPAVTTATKTSSSTSKQSTVPTTNSASSAPSGDATTATVTTTATVATATATVATTTTTVPTTTTAAPATTLPAASGASTSKRNRNLLVAVPAAAGGVVVLLIVVAVVIVVARRRHHAAHHQHVRLPALTGVVADETGGSGGNSFYNPLFFELAGAPGEGEDGMDQDGLYHEPDQQA